MLKQFSKHVTEVVNDHNSLRISARIPRTWQIFLFRSMIIEIDSYDGVLLLNKHGDLYFLSHNFIVQIIPFKNYFFFKLSEEKKIQLKTCTKPLTQGCKLRFENNDSRNVLSRCRFQLSDFSINYIRKCSICSKLSNYQVFFQMLPLKPSRLVTAKCTLSR